MIITINQNQIEQAIKNYVNSKMVIAEDQRLDIDLRATRGTEGYTAVIEVVDADAPVSTPNKSEEVRSAAPTAIREAVRQARQEPAETAQTTKPPFDTEEEPAEAEAAPDAPESQEQTKEADSATRKTSIFAKHTKISNDPAAT